MTSLHPAPPRHARPTRPLRIAILGTRGLPATDDGFETTVEEVGRRLVVQGHAVTVYGRQVDGSTSSEHLGMRCVMPPSMGTGRLEAWSRLTLSAAHLAATPRHDVVLVFGAEHAPIVPLLRSRATAVAVHAGGIGWQEDALSGLERRSARVAEQVAAREADALIVDSSAMQDYYDDEFALPTHLIRTGASIVEHAPSDLLEGLGLVPGSFHLAARPEAGSRAEVIIEGYHRSDARLPLVVVGAERLGAAVAAVADRDPRIVLLGEHHDPRLLDQLHAHALSAVHGRSMGGPNPSLVRSMGAGTAILAWDVVFNREAVGTAGSFFSTPSELARALEEVERYPFRFRDLGELMQERARRRFDWNAVSEQYEALAARLARAYSTRGMTSGRRIDRSRVPRTAPVEVTDS